jgi:hypothetical protein
MLARMTDTTNPWLALSREPPYILDVDRNRITLHNTVAPNDYKIIDHCVPEPFIGNPATAKVVLLLLNPGFNDKTDLASHSCPDFRTTIFKNLCHELQEYPFYPLNPAFSTTASAIWWRGRLRRLIEEVGEATLSQKLLAIQWFPYHSQRWNPKYPVWESQKYSFHIAKTMLREKGAKIVGMRSKKLWGKEDEGFFGVPYLKNPRNVCLSRANMEDGLFEDLVKILKGE